MAVPDRRVPGAILSQSSNRRFAMAGWKPFAVGVLVWGAVTGSIHADTLTWANGLWGQSRIQVYQQDAGRGNVVAPPPVDVNAAGGNGQPAGGTVVGADVPTALSAPTPAVTASA